MSAFLGSIHYWLYDKICLQEELTKTIAEQAKGQGWIGTAEAASYDIGTPGPLEQQIDHANIHGWLQDRIQEAEKRYAQVVTDLLKGDPDRLESLKATAYEFGKSREKAALVITPADAYKFLEDTLVNGMPCDHVNRVMEQDEHHLVWEQAQDLHGAFWTEIGGESDVYYQLRTELMKGLLEGSGLMVEKKEDQYTIVRV